jgi:hypothetical protein
MDRWIGGLIILCEVGEIKLEPLLKGTMYMIYGRLVGCATSMAVKRPIYSLKILMVGFGLVLVKVSQQQIRLHRDGGRTLGHKQDFYLNLYLSLCPNQTTLHVWQFKTTGMVMESVGMTQPATEPSHSCAKIPT